MIKIPITANALRILKTIISFELKYNKLIIYRGKDSEHYNFQPYQIGTLSRIQPEIFNFNETDLIHSLILESSGFFTIHATANSQPMNIEYRNTYYADGRTRQDKINFLKNLSKIKNLQKFYTLINHQKDITLHCTKFNKYMKFLKNIDDFTEEYPINYNFFEGIRSLVRVNNSKNYITRIHRGPFVIYNLLKDLNKPPDFISTDIYITFFGNFISCQLDDLLTNQNSQDLKLKLFSFIIDKNNLYERNRLRVTKQLLDSI